MATLYSMQFFVRYSEVNVTVNSECAIRGEDLRIEAFDCGNISQRREFSVFK
jgi:hypothetical protein